MVAVSRGQGLCLYVSPVPPCCNVYVNQCVCCHCVDIDVMFDVTMFRVLCGSMLEEMNKMNDENTILREEKKTFAARLHQQQQQLQDSQTAARARQTATRCGMAWCGMVWLLQNLTSAL